MYKKNFLFGLALLLFMVVPVIADVDQYNINYNIPVALQAPTIIAWSNSKTQDSSLNININTGEAVKFNVTANQGIDLWQWSKDGLIQINNYDNYTTSWSTTGNKIISVNGTNINGTTNIITWNINVNQLNQTVLSACGALNNANTIYVLNSSLSSNGTCFTIGANNVTLDGRGNNVNYAKTTNGYGIGDSGGYDNINIKNLTLIQQNNNVVNSHGIYLRNVINSRADNINIYTKNNSHGIYLSLSNSNIFSNIAANTNVGYGIYLASSNSNSFSNCNINTAGAYGDGIDLASSSSNSFTGCDVNTSGSYGDGIYLASSNYNSYSGNILTSGTGANGIWINTNSNYNNFSNMNVLAIASGAKINAANSNIIRDGSIISKLVNDYYLQNSPASNNFVNTNFTTRKIYFNDNNSSFNYANNNIALNTNQIVSPTKVLTVTRKLLSWSQTNVSWQETVSATRTLNYGVGGLMPNTLYSVWNGSIISYNLTTNNNGNLPNFTINLTTTAKVIKVTSS